MSEDRAIAHLEKLREDVRDEIKKRIEQRDKYSVQATTALSALVAVAFSKPEFAKVLIAAPLVSTYFTILILYSYRIHAVLATYMREAIEPELARRCGTPLETEWENFYQKHEVPGIRRSFFIWALLVAAVGSLVYLWFVEREPIQFTVLLSVATAAYLVSAAVTMLRFR